MPLAVTHVLIPIIVIDFYRDYFVKHKKAWPMKFILAAGIGGLLPDLDIVVGWFFYFVSGIDHWTFHRTLTHSIWFLLPFVIAAIILYFTKTQHNTYFKYASFLLSTPNVKVGFVYPLFSSIFMTPLRRYEAFMRRLN